MRSPLPISLLLVLLCTLSGTTAYASLASFSVDELRAAAARGDARAQNEFGVRLTEGRGIERNDFDAVRWFQKAALQGLLEAQYNLSVMYANGQGVRQDDEQTVKWSRVAARRGHPAAQYQLALLYAVGAGVKQDFERAYRWFSLAARSLEGADGDLARSDRDLVAKELTPRQIEAADRWVRKWTPEENAEILASIGR